MPRFFVLSGPDLGRSFELGEGALFGRAADCAAPMRASSISRNHARLERDGERWVLVDLGSRNGIQRAGARVERLELTDGLVFLLGDVELRFRAQDEASVRPIAIPPPPEPPPPAPRVEARAPEPPRAAAPARPAQPPAEIDEIELEHVELDDVAPARAARRDGAPSAPAGAPSARMGPQMGPPMARGAPAEARAPAPRAPREHASLAALERARLNAAPPAVELRDAGRPVLQYNRVSDARGFALSDLTQQPAWVKLLVWILGIALFAALFYAAFRGTIYLRERSRGEPEIIEAPPE